MGYRITYSNSMGAVSARYDRATDTLARINELRRIGFSIDQIVDESSGEAIGELTLEDYAEAENA